MAGLTTLRARPRQEEHEQDNPRSDFTNLSCKRRQAREGQIAQRDLLRKHLCKGHEEFCDTAQQQEGADQAAQQSIAALAQGFTLFADREVNEEREASDAADEQEFSLDLVHSDAFLTGEAVYHNGLE